MISREGSKPNPPSGQSARKGLFCIFPPTPMFVNIHSFISSNHALYFLYMSRWCMRGGPNSCMIPLPTQIRMKLKKWKSFLHPSAPRSQLAKFRLVVLAKWVVLAMGHRAIEVKGLLLHMKLDLKNRFLFLMTIPHFNPTESTLCTVRSIPGSTSVRLE
jgi:hypothetical protein